MNVAGEIPKLTVPKLLDVMNLREHYYTAVKPIV